MCIMTLHMVVRDLAVVMRIIRILGGILLGCIFMVRFMHSGQD